MRHFSSRIVIERVLHGDGFGDENVALALAAGLIDRGKAMGDLPHALETLAKTALVETAPPYTGTWNQLPIAKDEAELAAQLAPALAEHPVDAGLGLGALAALVELWPHVSADERPLLRVRFLNGVFARHAPADAQATIAQLTRWSRDLPTCVGGDVPQVATLSRLLQEISPEGAFRQLAEHLDPSVDFRQLASVLGALAVHLLVRAHDHERQVSHVLLGTVAVERLAGLVPGAVMATLIAQLAHQLWWCAQRAHLAPVVACLDVVTPPFAEAVRNGDISQAQRAARTLAHDPERFWTETWALIAQQLYRPDAQWPHRLAIAAAIAWRAHDGLAPDDAAALASVLADRAFREQIASSREPLMSGQHVHVST